MNSAPPPMSTVISRLLHARGGDDLPRAAPWAEWVTRFQR